MARNRILYGLAVLACLAFSMVYKENISAVILAAVLIYPLFAWLTTFVLMKLVKAEFSKSDILAEKGTHFELVLNVKNRFILPCVPMELVCDLPDEDTGLAAEKKIYVTLPPFGKAKLAMNCMNRYRGKYCFSVKKISVVDPLRIIRVTKKGKSVVNAVFVPRKLNVPDVSCFCESENFIAKRQSATDNKEDFSHVRDYIPGESVQLVHWKLTAKQGDLMLKQFDSVFDRKALILCDFGCCSRERDPLLCADTIIETAIAFVKTFLDENIFTDVDFGQTAECSCRVTNQSEFVSFFELMSVISPKSELGGFSSLMDKNVGGESVLVIVTAALTEDIILRANKLAAEESVFVAYINLSGKPLERSFDNERFLLMNIRGAGQDNLTEAVCEALE